MNPLTVIQSMNPVHVILNFNESFVSQLVSIHSLVDRYEFNFDYIVEVELKNILNHLIDSKYYNQFSLPLIKCSEKQIIIYEGEGGKML